MPDLGRNDVALEPYVRMEILTPSEYNGAIIELGQERRGELIDIKYLTMTRSTIVYELPLAEVITDFFNALKSATKGYGMCYVPSLQPDVVAIGLISCYFCLS